jgi:hypothetical protein
MYPTIPWLLLGLVATIIFLIVMNVWDQVHHGHNL